MDAQNTPLNPIQAVEALLTDNMGQRINQTLITGIMTQYVRHLQAIQPPPTDQPAAPPDIKVTSDGDN